MKQVLIILTLLALTSCDFKSSADYNAEAEKLEKEGKFEEAIPLLDKALEKDPENIYALINRGVDKSILEDYKGAIEDYSTIIELDPDNTLAYLNRGKCKKRLNDFQGAIDDFEKAIKTKGGEQIYIDLVENSFFDTGSEFDVGMEEIRFERAIARYNIDSLKTAFEDFNFCIEKSFELPHCYYYRGLIYLIYGHYELGCKDIQFSGIEPYPEEKKFIEKYCK